MILVDTVGNFNPDTDSSLSTGIIAFWNLDEQSGTRADSVGDATLVDNATVTF